MKKQEKFTSLGTLFCFGLIIMLCIATFLSPGQYDVKIRSSFPQAFNEGWKYLSDQGEEIPTPIPTNIEAQAHEKVTIVKTLPPMSDTHTTLLFRSSQQKVEAKINGETIYQFGNFTEHPFIKTSTSNWNIIPLPLDYQGKELHISLTSAYKGFAGAVNPFFIGEYAQCAAYVFMDGLGALCLSFFIIFIGLGFLMIYLIYRKQYAHANRMLFWGLFVLSIGIWSLGESKMDQFFFSNPYIEWVISLVALFLAPFWLLHFALINAENKKQIGYIQALIRLNILGNCLCFLLQLFGLYDLLETVFVPYVFFILSIIIFFWVSFSISKKTSQRWSGTGLIGVMIIAISIIIECIFYYYKQYWMIGNTLRMAMVLVSLVWGAISLKYITIHAKETNQLEIALENQRILTMASQIKPHFIYNTLGAIHGQIKSDPDTAEELVYNFSRYLRTNIDTVSNSDMIPFSQELTHIKTYARIEEIRFDTHVKVVFDVDCGEFFIPPLTIQPLVENAIKHGICQKPLGGTVVVKARETQEAYMVTVMDDGVGFTVEEGHKEKSKSAGIKNIQFRLTTMVNATVSMESTLGKGTIVTVNVPKKRENKKNENNFS